MENMKSFSTLLNPDERWANFVLVSSQTKQLTQYTLEERYNSFSRIRLSQKVPEDVQSQFNIAGMLGVYAWFYYPFHQVAELKVFATLEMALRLRFPNVKGGLKKLLTVAVDNGLIVDDGFSHILPRENDSANYSKKLPELISSMRNDLAHGTVTLHPGSLFTINNCAEILNQLFPDN